MNYIFFGNSINSLVSLSVFIYSALIISIYFILGALILKWKVFILLSITSLASCVGSESNNTYTHTEDMEPNNSLERSQILELEDRNDTFSGSAVGGIGEHGDLVDFYQFTMIKPTRVYEILVQDDRALLGHKPVLVSIYENKQHIHSGTSQNAGFIFNLLLQEGSQYTIAISANLETQNYWLNIQNHRQPNGSLIEGRNDGPSRVLSNDQLIWSYLPDFENNQCLESAFLSEESAEELTSSSDYEYGKCSEQIGSDIVGYCGIYDYFVFESERKVINYLRPMAIEEVITTCWELKGSFFSVIE